MTGSMETRKRRAEAFVVSLPTGHLDASIVQEGMTLWAPTRAEPMTFSELSGAVKLLHSLFEDDFRMVVERTIAEGDYVAVLSQSSGTLKDGTLYENRYHYSIRFADDLIIEAREFMDSQTVANLIRPRMVAVMNARAIE